MGFGFGFWDFWTFPFVAVFILPVHRSTLLSFLCVSQLFFSGIGFESGFGFGFGFGSGIGFDSQRFALVMWFQLIQGRG